MQFGQRQWSTRCRGQLLTGGLLSVVWLWLPWWPALRFLSFRLRSQQWRALGREVAPTRTFIQELQRQKSVWSTSDGESETRPRGNLVEQPVGMALLLTSYVRRSAIPEVYCGFYGQPKKRSQHGSHVISPPIPFRTVAAGSGGDSSDSDLFRGDEITVYSHEDELTKAPCED